MLQKYLQTQNIVLPVFVIGIIVNVFNVIACEIFISRLQLGLVGTALTQNLVAAFSVLCTVMYIYFSKCYVKTWAGFSKQAFLHWDQFLRLGIPGMFMLCIEWWSFEICQFLAGLFGEVQLATQILQLNIAALAFMIPLGISVAANIRVGNQLGANQPHAAKRSSKIAFVVVVITVTATSLLLLLLRNALPHLFTSDPDVIERMSALVYLLCIFVFFDHTQAVSAGILRGCGLQYAGAVYNVVGFYLIGAPVLYVTAFQYDLEIVGLWSGLITAAGVQCIACLYHVFFRIDYKKEAQKASTRIALNNDTTSSSFNNDDETDSLDAIDVIENGKVDKLVCFNSDDVRDCKDKNYDSDNNKNGDNEDDDDTMELLGKDDTDEDDMDEKEVSLSSSIRLPNKIVRSRVLWSLACALVLIAAIIGRVSSPNHPICYPIPEVLNATEVCGRYSSLLANSECGATCEEGFNLVGKFSCDSNGILVELAKCVLDL
eukprot:m.84816 g.84816  ORF g.84816 m.84816 type:complete len:488 (-) comp12171_c0_seq1:285-1748(-)